jgi:hypothetical protein
VGQKDSLVVNDTTVIPLFYPRVRFEHSISYSTYKYRFKDNTGDSLYYARNYGIIFPTPLDTFFRRDFWRDITNDFSVYQFPDAKTRSNSLSWAPLSKYSKPILIPAL